ncbi:MAG: MgtC/SapB family protein [Dinoroseobacter sp.]|nr:MgtC/SapB family protein [Dinoroseobacter sp.]
MVEVTPELFQEFVVNVTVAILCGGLIGLERQLRGKPAGLRVCILVVLTTALFVTLAAELAVSASDQLRVMASVISGVGFLGAGVIFSRGARVSGITTATLIWMLAAVGCTIGFGYPYVAALATIIVMSVLALIDVAEALVPRLKENSDSVDEEIQPKS